MAEVLKMARSSANRRPIPSAPAAISDELARMAALVRGALPEVAGVSFAFDSRLQLHIDVRKREDVTIVQLILPGLESGLFQAVGVGRTPGHPFHHRITAFVQA